MSRCASAEVVEPVVALARRRSRASSAGSKRIESGAAMYYIVALVLHRTLPSAHYVARSDLATWMVA